MMWEVTLKWIARDGTTQYEHVPWQASHAGIAAHACEDTYNNNYPSLTFKWVTIRKIRAVVDARSTCV